MMLQVEHTLMLRFEGFVTCESAAAFKAKMRSSPIIKKLNTVSRKESTRFTDFNHTNWGDNTNGYLLSIKKNLSSDSKFDRIVDKAMHIAMTNQRRISQPLLLLMRMSTSAHFLLMILKMILVLIIRLMVYYWTFV